MKTIKMIFPMLLFIGIISFQSKAQEHQSKDGVYFTVEEMPVYPGGDEALRNLNS